MLDEALHAVFIQVARQSEVLTDAERAERFDFVEALAAGAYPIVSGNLDAYNIKDTHLWCSALAEAAAVRGPLQERNLSFGLIKFPRSGQDRHPERLRAVRVAGVNYIRAIVQDNPNVVDVPGILSLVGAASCPSIWHHPAAVRYSLQPLMRQGIWPPADTTSVAVPPKFDDLEREWSKRGAW